MAYYTRTQADTYIAANFPDNSKWSGLPATQAEAYLERVSDRFDALPWVTAPTTPYSTTNPPADGRIESAFYICLDHLSREGDFIRPVSRETIGAGSEAPVWVHEFIADLPYTAQTILQALLTLPLSATEQPRDKQIEVVDGVLYERQDDGSWISRVEGRLQRRVGDRLYERDTNGNWVEITSIAEQSTPQRQQSAPISFTGQCEGTATSTAPSGGGTGGEPTDLTDLQGNQNILTVTRRNGQRYTITLPVGGGGGNANPLAITAVELNGSTMTFYHANGEETEIVIPTTNLPNNYFTNAQITNQEGVSSLVLTRANGVLVTLTLPQSGGGGGGGDESTNDYISAALNGNILQLTRRDATATTIDLSDLTAITELETMLSDAETDITTNTNGLAELRNIVLRTPTYTPSPQEQRWEGGLIDVHQDGDITYKDPFISVASWRPGQPQVDLDADGITLGSNAGRRTIGGLGGELDKTIYVTISGSPTGHLVYIPGTGVGTQPFFGVNSQGQYEFYNPDRIVFAAGGATTLQDAVGPISRVSGDTVGYNVEREGEGIMIVPVVFRAAGNKIECNDILFDTENAFAHYDPNAISVNNTTPVTYIRVAKHSGVGATHNQVASATTIPFSEGLGLRVVGAGKTVLTQTEPTDFETLTINGKAPLLEGDTPGTTSPTIDDNSVTRPKLSAAVRAELDDIANKANKSDLATVAESGDAKDLSGTLSPDRIGDNSIVEGKLSAAVQEKLNASGGGEDDPNLHAAWDGTGKQITSPTWQKLFSQPYSNTPLTSVRYGGSSLGTANLTDALPTGVTSTAAGRLQMAGSRFAELLWQSSGVDYRAISATFRVVRAGTHQNVGFLFGVDGGVTNWDAFTSGTTKGLMVSSSISAGRLVIQRADDKRYLNAAGQWSSTKPAGGVDEDAARFTPVEGDNFFRVGYFEGRIIVELNGTRIVDVFLDDTTGTTPLPDLTGNQHGGILQSFSTSSTLTFNAITINDPNERDLFGDEMSNGGGGTAEKTTDASELTSGILPPARIGDGSIVEVKLDGNSVSTGKIKPGAVTNSKIGDSQVTAQKIGTSAVTGPKISNGAVTNAKLGNGAVDEGKLAQALRDKLNAASASRFIDLTDTPAALGEVGQLISVAPTGNDLEFINRSALVSGATVYNGTASPNATAPTSNPVHGDLYLREGATSGIWEYDGDLTGWRQRIGAASTTARGLVERATDAEVVAATDAERYITVASLKAALDGTSSPLRTSIAAIGGAGFEEALLYNDYNTENFGLATLAGSPKGYKWVYVSLRTGTGNSALLYTNTFRGSDVDQQIDTPSFPQQLRLAGNIYVRFITNSSPVANSWHCRQVTSSGTTSSNSRILQVIGLN